MPNVVEGKNVTLSMLVDESYKDLLCGIDCTLNRNVEFVEKTSPTSGRSRQVMPRLQEWISTISGLTLIDNGTTLSWFYLLSITDEQTFKMTFEDDEGNQFLVTGPGFMGTMGINAPATDFSNATIELRWNGEPDTTEIEPPLPPGVFELYIDETNGLAVGATSVSHVDLTQAGVEALGAARSGTGLIETTGTPASGSQEFKFTAGTGTIATDSDNPYNAGEWIYVLYKIT